MPRLVWEAEIAQARVLTEGGPRHRRRYVQGGLNSGIEAPSQRFVDVKSSPDASPLSEQYETVAGLLSVTVYPGWAVHVPCAQFGMPSFVIQVPVPTADSGVHDVQVTLFM